MTTFDASMEGSVVECVKCGELIRLGNPESAKKRVAQKKRTQAKADAKEAYRYPALTLWRQIVAGYGWALIVLSIFAGAVFALTEQDATAARRFLMLAGWVLAGGIVGIPYIACSELIKVFVDIEKNTRSRPS